MTDPKPATPATDEQVQAWIELGADGRLFIPAHVIDLLVARIAADAEIIKARDVELDRCHEVIADFSDRIDKQAEGKAMSGYAAVVPELTAAREQVRVLREALRAAMGLCDCSDYNGKALVPCTESYPCVGCSVTRTGQAALAATEPKG